MLTILDRQMIYNYVKAYVFCLVSLMSLFIVIDLFINLEDFTAQRRDFGTVVQFIATYYGYKSFQIFDRLCEAVVLLAGMFTVAWMQRNNELLPLLSAGVSTRRVVMPVILCASAMMGLVVVNQEFALPHIDIWMLENRQNPEGTREADERGRQRPVQPGLAPDDGPALAPDGVGGDHDGGARAEGEPRRPYARRLPRERP